MTTGHVGVFRADFPLPSETFISEQMRALKRYTPILLTRTQLGETVHECLAVSTTRGWLGQKIFTIRPRVEAFGDLDLMREIHLLHAHFGPDGTIALPLAKALRVPLLVTFHGYDVTVSRTSLKRVRNLAWLRYRALGRCLSKHAAAFIAVSQFIRARLLTLGYPAEKIIVHHIGVDTVAFAPPGNRTRRDKVVVNVARHTEKKGVDALIRAFRLVADKYPDATLIQVGAGHTTRQLETLVRVLGLERRVRLMGALPHAEVRGLLQRAAVFALTSQTASDGDSEALGIVLNEASASGCAIVATRHGGIPEAVIDGETGLLAPEGDIAGIADRLDGILGDPGLAEQMGRRGRQLVCDKFDLRAQTAVLEGIYDRVVAEYQERASGQVKLNQRVN